MTLKGIKKFFGVVYTVYIGINIYLSSPALGSMTGTFTKPVSSTFAEASLYHHKNSIRLVAGDEKL